jgi:prolipoprotein diacylglyceryltransferase
VTVFLTLEVFFCEGFMSPSISMMTITAPPRTQGAVVALFLIVLSIGGLFAASVTSRLLPAAKATTM